MVERQRLLRLGGLTVAATLAAGGLTRALAVVARAELARSTTTSPDNPSYGMRAALRFVLSHPDYEPATTIGARGFYAR